VISFDYWAGKADSAVNEKVQSVLATPELVH
jgi:hypothetical protein